MKVVINRCFGGFGLSHEAIMKYAALAQIDMIAVEKDKTSTMLPWEYYVGKVSDETYWSEYDISRTDPSLVKVVEQMGADANGFAAELKVVEIPDDILWHLCEYDGIEHIAEDHRTWR
jgi:hypothetical protein